MRSSRATCFTLLSTITVGCGAEVVFLPLPVLPGARVVLVSVDRVGGPTEITAYDWAAPPERLPIDLGGSREATLEIYASSHPLEALGLAAGPVVSVVGVPVEPLPLDGASILRARLRAGAESSWEPQAAPSGALADLRIAQCDDLVLTRVELGLAQGRTGVVASSPTVALIGFQNLDYRRLSGERVEALTTTIAAVAGFALAGGEYQIAAGGRTWRMRDEGDRLRAVEAATSLSSENLVALAGGETERGVELFALDSAGTLLRVQGGVIESLEQLPTRGTPRLHVVWLGPGGAVAASEDASFVVRYRDGVLARFDAASLGVSALAHVFGFGTVIGTLAGAVFVLEGDVLRELEVGAGRLEAIPVAGIAPFRGGLLVLRNNETLTEIRPDGTVCPDRAAPIEIVNAAVTTVGDFVYLVGSPSGMPQLARGRARVFFR